MNQNSKIICGDSPLWKEHRIVLTTIRILQITQVSKVITPCLCSWGERSRQNTVNNSSMSPVTWRGYTSHLGTQYAVCIVQIAHGLGWGKQTSNETKAKLWPSKLTFFGVMFTGECADFRDSISHYLWSDMDHSENSHAIFTENDGKMIRIPNISKIYPHTFSRPWFSCDLQNNWCMCIRFLIWLARSMWTQLIHISSTFSAVPDNERRASQAIPIPSFTEDHVNRRE